ncbi:enoyl-CoA hydratase-related protein [Hyphobacterium sp. SN044]|uniref:enoyl-CoA hydratase-related protein n=1 Tax=Hyphobacterium sp. SN044 TaxID=2912575 RepID=UPI001EFFAE93|nr:enoyl-CoA hydratase-related protein [Hyphobacterium sp. SN044]MCF8878865.1 enoyl-CoA hydratase-related protein [Hyphobacterium sp. SN044]
MSDAHILTERRGDVTIIRFNRPERMNAMAARTVCELHAALKELGSARAVLLTGGSRAFSSGADLASGDPVPSDENGPDLGATLETGYNPLLLTLRDLSVPVVAAVNGPAAGVGCSLALACDLIVAGETAYFLQAFSRIGLVPDGGAAFLLASGAGKARAMEAMLLAEKIPATTALDWGLINRVVPDGEVEQTAFDLATKLAAGPTLALGRTRRAAWSALQSGFEDHLDLERRDQRDAGRTTDFAEGVAAFLEKRPAKFQGR